VRKDFEAFFVAAAAYSQLFCGLLGKYLLVSELNNADIIRRVFFRLQFSVDAWQLGLAWQCLFTQFLSMAIA